MNEERIEWPPRINIGTAHIENYLPRLQSDIQRYGNHQFMDGLDTGLAIADKFSAWLTSEPPVTHEDLRKWVINEMKSILDKHKHRAPVK